MTLYGSFIVYSKDVFSEHNCRTRASLSSINIISNISYEGMLKHRIYMLFLSVVFYLPWSSWIIFIQNNCTFSVIIFYHLTFLWFLFNVDFLTTMFPSQLNLSSLLPYWSPPPILVDTISRDVVRIKTYF